MHPAGQGLGLTATWMCAYLVLRLWMLCCFPTHVDRIDCMLQHERRQQTQKFGQCRVGWRPRMARVYRVGAKQIWRHTKLMHATGKSSQPS